MGFIRGENLTREYQMGKVRVNALRGVTFDIERGEYVCVVGPSGAGKSTLLNIVGLLDTPTSGRLEMDGCDVMAMSERDLHRFRRDRITFIFQSFNLISVFTAYENIEFPLMIQRVPRGERRRRIMHFCEAVGIREYLSHKPDELSGGQRQRVAIARALVTDPELVLADEPTANLDSQTGQTILDLISRINLEEKTTFLIASHDAPVMRQANRVIRIVDGRIAS